MVNYQYERTIGPFNYDPGTALSFYPTDSHPTWLLIGQGADYPGNYYVYDSNGSQVRTIYYNNRQRGANWSPDGQYLVIGAQSSIYLVRTSDWSTIKSWTTSYDAFPIFHPKYNFIISSHYNGVLKAYNFSGSQVKDFGISDGNIGWPPYPSVSQNGKYLSFATSSKIYVWNIDNSDPNAWSLVQETSNPAGAAPIAASRFGYCLNDRYYLLPVSNKLYVFTVGSDGSITYQSTKTYSADCVRITSHPISDLVSATFKNSTARIYDQNLNEVQTITQSGEGSCSDFSYANSTYFAVSFDNKYVYIYKKTDLFLLGSATISGEGSLSSSVGLLYSLMGELRGEGSLSSLCTCLHPFRIITLRSKFLRDKNVKSRFLRDKNVESKFLRDKNIKSAFNYILGNKKKSGGR